MNQPVGESGERRNKTHSRQAEPSLQPGLSPGAQPSLAFPSPGPIRPPSLALQRLPVRDTYRSAWARDTHTFSCHNKKPPTSTKQKPGGRGRSKAESLLEEMESSDTEGGTTARRRHANTEPLCGPPDPPPARRWETASPAEARQPAPATALPGTVPRAGRALPSGGGQAPLPLPAGRARPPALGVTAAETATPSGDARPRHGRPSPALFPPPRPLPPSSLGTDLAPSQTAQPGPPGGTGKRLEGPSGPRCPHTRCQPQDCCRNHLPPAAAALRVAL